LFNDPFQLNMFHGIANVSMTVNDTLQKLWKEAVISYIKV